MFNFIKQHKVLASVVFLNIVAVLVVILIIVLHNAKTAVVDVYVAPSEATIEINGRRYDNLQSYDFLPGDYHAVISMDGMQTKEVDFSVGEDGFYRLWEYLLDANGGFEYYINKPGEESILAKVANDEASLKFVEEYETVAAIMDILPIEVDEYTSNFEYYIRYSIQLDTENECEKVACLVIDDYTGGNEQRALEKIRSEGFDPEDYGIKYEYDPLYTAGMSNE